MRVTHNFTPNAGEVAAPERGGGGGGRGGFGGGGGRFGRGQQQGTSVNMTAQLQYRRTNSDQNNIFPTLGGEHQRVVSRAAGVAEHPAQADDAQRDDRVTRAPTSDGFNQYAFVQNVAGAAGIGGVSTDPFDWGVPQLSFSSLTGVRDATPSRRTDERLSLGYGWTKPVTTRHTLRLGGGFAARSLRQPNRPECARCVRLHRLVFIRWRGGRARRRTRLRRFPPRPAAAGDAAVRPGGTCGCPDGR